MLVADAVAQTLAALGADTVFGLVGSGNFRVTTGLADRGIRYVAARHECGAVAMADGWARLAGKPGLASVHQGPGLTNALTAVTEAAKSGTPLVVLAADVAGAAVHSNFRINVAAIAAAVGALPERLYSPASAVADTARAWQAASRQHRTVLLAMPLDVQAAQCDPPGERELAAAAAAAAPLAAAPAPEAAAELAGALARAARPVFIAGRGARAAGARACLEELAQACGALLATSAAAKGLFRGTAWDLDVSGGFATPAAAELIAGADLLVGWGCSLNMWTTRHGTLVGADCLVAQVDEDPAAIGAHVPAGLGVLGDVALTARAVLAALGAGRRAGYRTAQVRGQIERSGRWRDVGYADESGGGRIDPRTLSIRLDDLLPAERIVAVDSGNFMGYPTMFLSVPDEQGFCFTQGYQSIGLGLASAIGSAIARPDRLTVAALGDGGALMGVSELETAARLGLPMVIVVYDDEAYGAEVHHFRPNGQALDTVTFPPADIAAIGRGFGCDGVTVRRSGDLALVSEWLGGVRERPLVVDAKITSAHGSWWLEEAFRGH